MGSLLKSFRQSGITNRDSAGFLILCGMVSISGGLLFGYNTGVIAPALRPLASHYGDLDAVMQGIVTCSTLLGAMIGSATGASLIEFLGNKLCMLLLGFLCIIGALFSAFCPALWGVIGIRLILGIGVGLATVVCPGWGAQMSPYSVKGLSF